jgi:hypothetical protein
MNRVYVCLAAAVLLSSAAFAQSAPPSADTYSNSMKGDTGVNYGSSSLLVVQTHGNNSYLQFNLSTVPAGATINKATLRLFVDALVTPGSFDVYQLNTSWSESTLTFSNAPPLGVSATGVHPVAVSKVNQFVVVDITSLVQGWQSGAIPNNGIALAMTTSTGSFSFDSKESVFTSHQPELEIVLTGVAGPQGPAGAQGPQGVQGTAGATGATGPAGVAGATGAQGVAGPIGPQGIKGDTGANGAQGAQGIQGLTGNTGATGAIGPQGIKGDTGATGPQGTQGIQGLTGNTGATGAIGPQGIKGDTGATGPQGTQGPIGNTGATGAVGPMGVMGAQGPAGNDGAPGTNGAAGTNGTGFNFRNAFDSSATYAAYDVVTYSGSTYNATVPIPAGSGNPDMNSGWTLMAQAGAPGNTGTQGPQGPQGNTGNTGNTGAQGPQGPEGFQGPAGTNGTGFNFIGAFSSSTSYNVNDVATYNGSTYVATVANQGGNAPDQNAADWTLMAQAGATGPAGAAGAPGSQGPQGNIGPTGAQGSQGVQGVPGPAGPQGPPGTSSGGALYVVPFSSTPIFDASQGSVLEITLTGNVASSTFVNAAAGQTISIILCQDSVGGHAFVPPVNVQWSTLGTTTPGYCAAEQFAFDGTTAFYLGPIAYQVIAPINNLTGSGLALNMNGGTVAVPAAATMVTLPSLYSGQTYQMSVAQQPTAPVQTCTVAGNAIGIVQGMNVSTPVNCVGPSGPPTNPVLTSPGHYQLTASWTPPASNGGSTLTGYTVVLTNSAGQGGVAQTVSGTATSAIFTAVNPGCPGGITVNILACAGYANFTFQVIANNSFGAGVPSITSNAVGSPGPPTNVVENLINPNGFNCSGTCEYNITYTAPTNTGGAPLTQICAGLSGALPPAACTPPPYTLFAMSPTSQQQYLQVVAVNVFGAVSSYVY